MEASGNDQTGITLAPGSDGRTLIATFAPASGRFLDRGVLQAALIAQGYAEWHLKEEAVEGLIRKGNAAAVSFSLEIGERRDGEVEIEISPDKMEAVASVAPAQGGAPITVETLRAMLAERGVVHGIVEEELVALAKRGGTKRVVAHGTPP
jgi:hypothetical protein